MPPTLTPPLKVTYDTEKLVLKIYTRLLLYAKISYANKEKIGTFLDYLNTLAYNNKLSNDGDKQLMCGPRSIDEMFLDSITRKHLSSEKTDISNIRYCPDEVDDEADD